MRRVRDLTGSAVVVALGVGFLAVTVWHFAQEVRTLSVLLPPVVAATLGVGLALTVVYAGLHLAGDDLDPRASRVVAAWVVGGTVLLVVVSALTVVIRLAEGRTVEEPILDLLIHGEVGALAGFVAGMAYVEAKQAAARAERARDALGFLNSTLRHEVLNGVNAIQGWAERVGNGETNGEAVTVICDRCTEIADLIEDVRPMTRTLTGNAPLTPTDLSATVVDSAAAVRAAHPEATVTVDAPPNVVVVADDGLARVVSNLLTNAVEHSDVAAPTVRVSVAERGERVRLTVVDDGPGVPDAKKAEIFEPDTTLDRGFGLYMTRVLVERYGGEVWVEDADPRGAAFTVELDRASEESAARHAPVAE